MKRFTSKKQRFGLLGENIACKYLRLHGFRIIERNVTKNYGEIDIVARKGGITHFIEVKSTARRLDSDPPSDVLDATDTHRPEDMVHRKKASNLKKMIQTYGDSIGESPWCFDVICVFIDESRRRARIKILGDIVL